MSAARTLEIALHLCRGAAPGTLESDDVVLAMREVRAIYHQGVHAVAAAFRQLYGWLRSYISTMKKQGQDVMETIRSVLAGTTILPSTLRC